MAPDLDLQSLGFAEVGPTSDERPGDKKASIFGLAEFKGKPPPNKVGKGGSPLVLSCSVTLEKKGTPFFGAWTILVGQPPKKRGKREPLNN